jgi:hypothetical protein
MTIGSNREHGKTSLSLGHSGLDPAAVLLTEQRPWMNASPNQLMIGGITNVERQMVKTKVSGGERWLSHHLMARPAELYTVLGNHPRGSSDSRLPRYDP